MLLSLKSRFLGFSPKGKWIFSILSFLIIVEAVIALSMLGRVFARPIALCYLNEAYYETCRCVPRLGNVEGNCSNWYANTRQENGSGHEYDLDPVDIGQGVHSLTETFAVVPGRLPFPITWSFRSLDGSEGPMGLGTSLSTDYYMSYDAQTQKIRLIC
ncbi:MAG: hypothetical protein NTX57_09810, partial [Armatimonadetes bacterium]|nr:hypothetical protein [Armatimonadota bacterium]